MARGTGRVAELSISMIIGKVVNIDILKTQNFFCPWSWFFLISQRCRDALIEAYVGFTADCTAGYHKTKVESFLLRFLPVWNFFFVSSP